MPYSIPSSTKIFTLAAAPFYCTLSKKKVRSSSLEHRCTHSAAHSRKRFKLCLPLYYYGKVIVELEKTQTRNLILFMVLVI